MELQVSKATISKWEGGHSTPDLQMLIRIKQLFADPGFSLDALAGDLVDNAVAEPGGHYADDHPRWARTPQEQAVLIAFRNLGRLRQRALLQLLAD